MVSETYSLKNCGDTNNRASRIASECNLFSIGIINGDYFFFKNSACLEQSNFATHDKLATDNGDCRFTLLEHGVDNRLNASGGAYTHSIINWHTNQPKGFLGAS